MLPNELPWCARSSPTPQPRAADLKAALFEAGLAFAHASAETVMGCIRHDRTFYLPAGAGLLVCSGVHGQLGDLVFDYARARTWLTHAMARPGQTPLPPADDDAETMGDHILMAARRRTLR